MPLKFSMHDIYCIYIFFFTKNNKNGDAGHPWLSIFRAIFFLLDTHKFETLTIVLLLISCDNLIFEQYLKIPVGKPLRTKLFCCKSSHQKVIDINWLRIKPITSENELIKL